MSEQLEAARRELREALAPRARPSRRCAEADAEPGAALPDGSHSGQDVDDARRLMPRQPRLLAQVALVVARPGRGLASRDRFLLVTVCPLLVAMVNALSAQRAVWAAMGAAAIAGAATALFGPLLRPWRPFRTWLIMLTTSAFDLGVILVLAPP